MDNFETLQALIDRLQAHGDKECVLQMEREGVTRWTCAQVATAAQEVAAGLVEAGLQPGEFVPLLAKNRPEWTIAALAIIAAGGAVSPLDSQIKPEILGQVLANSQARFIFTTTEYLNRLNQLELTDPPQPILLDVAADDERGWQARRLSTTTSLPTVQPDDPATLFFTSGTTGVPKGVMLTHRNLTFQLKSIDATGLIHNTDRVLLPLPMYHVYPFTIGTLAPLTFGLPIILPQSLTGPQIIRALTDGEATIIVGVPRVYRAVFNGLESQINNRGKPAAAIFNSLLNLSIGLRRRFGWQLGQPLFKPLRRRLGPQVRLLTSGGSALDPTLAWKLEGIGWNVAIGYGLTETSPMLTMNLPRDRNLKLDSVGQPLPGIELRIAPAPKLEDGDDAPEDAPQNESGYEEGEIQARGASVFSGYRQRPEETRQSFTDDGWFRTGDLGYFDEEQFLYINGRASTLIVLEGGKNIQPEPLEDMYEQHQFIKEIGVLYEDNQLAALIVPEPDPINRLRNGDVNQAIREAVNDRLQAVASYQRISDYVITDTPLPRTNLGKIRRHVLADYYRQAKEGTLQANKEAAGPIAVADMSEPDRALLENDVPRKVWDWLTERYHDKNLTPDTSPQLELGVDSLEWLTLSLQVSDLTGVELSDEAIVEITTVRELLEAVQTAAESDSEPTAISENPEESLSEEQKKWLRPLGSVQEKIAMAIFFGYQKLYRLLFGLRVYGLENLPAQGNFVLTPNHTSMLDAPTLVAALPPEHLKNTQWAGAADIMFTNPLTRLVSRLARVLPIERYGAGTGAKNLALALAAIQRGRNLVWFPEGRISTTDQMLSFREGIGLILERDATPVVPVYIEGARTAMPAEASLPRFKPINLTFGPPCDPRQLAEEGEAERPAAAIAQALQTRVTALSERAHTDHDAPEERSNPGPMLVLGAVAALAALLSSLIWWLFRRRK